MAFNVEAASFTPKGYKRPPAAPASPAPKAPSTATSSTAGGDSEGAPSPPPVPPPEASNTSTVTKDSPGSNHKKELSPDAPVFQPKSNPNTTKKSGATTKPKPPLPSAPVSAMEAVSKKTVDEVLEVAVRSTFKVTGNSFIPANYVPKAPVNLVVAPTAGGGGATTTHPQPEKAAVMTLRDSWSLYFIDRSLVTETNFDPILVFRMDCIEDFCRVFNHIPTASDMPAQSTYYLFRADVAPKWEDARNIEGGCWQLRFRSTDKVLDDVWERVCAQSVGEKWLFDEHRDAVNGLVLKSRNNFHILQIWVAEKKTHFPKDLLRAVEEVLPAFDIDYYDHQTLRDHSHAAPPKKKRGGKGNKQRK